MQMKQFGDWILPSLRGVENTWAYQRITLTKHKNQVYVSSRWLANNWITNLNKNKHASQEDNKNPECVQENINNSHYIIMQRNKQKI